MFQFCKASFIDTQNFLSEEISIVFTTDKGKTRFSVLNYFNYPLWVYISFILYSFFPYLWKYDKYMCTCGSVRKTFLSRTNQDIFLLYKVSNTVLVKPSCLPTKPFLMCKQYERKYELFFSLRLDYLPCNNLQSFIMTKSNMKSKQCTEITSWEDNRTLSNSWFPYILQRRNYVCKLFDYLWFLFWEIFITTNIWHS